jgi:hypothetical protein
MKLKHQVLWISDAPLGARGRKVGDGVEGRVILGETADGTPFIVRWIEDSARLLEDLELEACPDHGRLATTN